MYNKVSEHQILFLGLYLMFFSRLITSIGVPSIVNFLHYGIIFILWIVIFNNKIQKVQLVFFLLIFTSILFSATINMISVINSIMEYLLITQPFILYWIIHKLQQEPRINKKLYKLVISISTLNFIFAVIQKIIGFEHDNIRGFFLGLGMASHILGAIAIQNIILVSILPVKKNTKILVIVSQFAILLWVDNKQSLLVAGISLVVYIFINFRDFKRVIKYLSLILVGICTVYLLGTTISPALLIWASVDKLNNGLMAKLEVFPRLLEEMPSLLNVIVGFGPGTTVGRLAQMLPDYPFLISIGADVSPITSTMWYYQQANYYSNSTTGSSLWMNFFSISGLFGDLGLFGLVVVVGGGFTFIYKKLSNPYAKLIWINVILHGSIFQWWEEPIYMAYSVIVMLLIDDGRILSNERLTKIKIKYFAR